jgi:hypothetical protein
VLRQSGDGEASSSVIAARPGRTASLQFQRTLNDEQKEGFVHFVKIAAAVQIDHVARSHAAGFSIVVP